MLPLWRVFAISATIGPERIGGSGRLVPKKTQRRGVPGIGPQTAAEPQPFGRTGAPPSAPAASRGPMIPRTSRIRAGRRSSSVAAGHPPVRTAGAREKGPDRRGPLRRPHGRPGADVPEAQERFGVEIVTKELVRRPRCASGRSAYRGTAREPRGSPHGRPPAPSLGPNGDGARRYVGVAREAVPLGVNVGNLGDDPDP